MTDNQNQPGASGCLSRVFTLVGLFWVGVLVVDLITDLQAGGDIQDFDFTGGIVPALAFLFAGSIMRRRMRDARGEDTFVSPSTPEGTHRATTTTQPSADRGPTPSPSISVAPAKERPKDEKRDRSRPVPELPPIEPVPDPGQLEAIEDLEVSDFEASASDTKGMSSEEMVRRAREKFLPKKPKAPGSY